MSLSLLRCISDLEQYRNMIRMLDLKLKIFWIRNPKNSGCMVCKVHKHSWWAFSAAYPSFSLFEANIWSLALNIFSFKLNQLLIQLTKTASDCGIKRWCGKLKSFSIPSDFPEGGSAKHYQKNKNKNPAYFLHLSSKLEDYLLDFSFQRELHCYLVNHASSHMLVSKIKSCMSTYKHLYCETANGSLNQLSFIWLYLLFDGYLW